MNSRNGKNEVLALGLSRVEYENVVIAHVQMPYL